MYILRFCFVESVRIRETVVLIILIMSEETEFP